MRKLLMISVSVLATLAGAYALTPEQKVQYQKAIQLIQSHDYDQYYRLKAQLRNTDLFPYLQFLEITTDPDHFQQSTIQRFIQQQKGGYWVAPLKSELANHYAKTQQWELFKAYYDGRGGASGSCWEMTANYALGDKNTLNQFTAFWQQRVAVPSECDSLFEQWKASEYMTKEAIIVKAMTLANAGRLTPAIDLLAQYKIHDAQLLDYLHAWRLAFTDPVKGLNNFYSQYHDREDFNRAFNGVIASLSNRQAESLAIWWDQFPDKEKLTEAQQQTIIVQIATGLARTHNTLAQQWFVRVKPEYMTDLLLSWQLRYAIYTSDFSQYLKWYELLPASDKQDSVWQYWLARSYVAIDQKDKAMPIYEHLAKSRSYYGFMAADRLGVDYSLTSTRYTADPKDLNQVSSQLAIRQARDLYQLEVYDHAIDLWRWQVNQFERPQVLASALWASDNNMYQQAVYSYGRGAYREDLQGRFPFAFKDDVQAAAKRFDLPPSVILSVMKQESLFGVEAQSFANAQGLMQLLPSTADFLAQRYRLPFAGNANLFDPQQNIILGSANLHFLDGLFKDNLVLGLASYNAGQGNVGRWLPDEPIEADQWIESIPFGETRHYVRGILSYVAVYEGVIFENKDYHLSSIMPMISQQSRTR